MHIQILSKGTLATTEILFMRESPSAAGWKGDKPEVVKKIEGADLSSVKVSLDKGQPQARFELAYVSDGKRLEYHGVNEFDTFFFRLETEVKGVRHLITTSEQAGDFQQYLGIEQGLIELFPLQLSLSVLADGTVITSNSYLPITDPKTGKSYQEVAHV